MAKSSWELSYHLRSPRGWLNDPNGACEFRGEYYLYYQYNPFWPGADQKAWGLFVSPDLVHWRYEGVPIEPSIPEDRNGVYSGCTLVERGAAADGGDRLRAYYTGNVVCPSANHDPRDRGLTYDGREANEITCVCEDGLHYGPRTVLLRNEDYPSVCTLHVRDPKVWEEDGQLHMILGARHVDHRGMCLLYDSADGETWELRQLIESEYPFGYMWECPNIVQLADGSEYLAFSPQGLPRTRDRWHNLCQAGYIALPGRILDTTRVDERDFVEWDHGHDFYAPQTFVDDAGRWILVGWLGGFDRRMDYAPDGLPWCHCLTVPRVLSRDEQKGGLLQAPVPELEALRGEAVELARGREAAVAGRAADVMIAGIEGDGTLTLDQSLQVFFEQGRLGIRYLVPAHARGREERSVPLAALRDLRVLVDGSCVEVYANGGSTVFSSRWFPEERDTLLVRCELRAKEAVAWPMQDVLGPMYATAQAPTLAFPGIQR